MPLWGLRSPHADCCVNRGATPKGGKERDMTKRHVHTSAADSPGLQNRNAPNTFVDSFLLPFKEEQLQGEGRSEVGIKGKKISRKKEQIWRKSIVILHHWDEFNGAQRDAQLNMHPYHEI